jgi:hypothetical protein
VGIGPEHAIEAVRVRGLGNVVAGIVRWRGHDDGLVILDLEVWLGGRQVCLGWRRADAEECLQRFRVALRCAYALGLGGGGGLVC